MTDNVIKLFLRIAISLSFLSAVADRFGLWGEKYSAWGNWNNFIHYAKVINPWLPDIAVNIIGALSTGAEIIFAICLLVGYKTEFFAKLSGFLLLIFGLSMTFSTGIKGAFDASVFSASAGAFALGLLKYKFLEVDSIFRVKRY
jgi:uncharacterized membrane protein YphA (DoxX/SURF4 family)